MLRSHFTTLSGATLSRLLSPLFCLLLAAGLCRASAQSPPDPLHTVLTNALRKAALTSEGTPAFHLEATYTTFDFLGHPASSGKILEDFLKPGFSKLTVHDDASSEQYAPEDQAAIGAPATAPSGDFMQRLLTSELLRPGLPERFLDAARLKQKELKLGTVTLTCITVISPPASKPGNFKHRGADPTYCMQSDGTLRVAADHFDLQATMNRLATFGGHTVPQEITLQQRGKVRGKLEVTKLVLAPGLTEAAFPQQTDERPLDPAAGATKIASDVVAGKILRKVNPIYPESAKHNHISGAVTLHAIISKTGSVESVEVISAPSEDLAEAAVDAVSQWEYAPYLLAGKPTEVDTTITVNFYIG